MCFEFCPSDGLLLQNLRGILMRHLAGSFCSLGLGVSAFCHAVMADSKPELTAPDAVVFRTAAGMGQQHFALALRSSSAPAEVRRHVVLVDTSASQTGKFRQGSIQLLSAVLERLPAGHTVMVAAVDSSYVPLTDGFVVTGCDDLKQAVTKLSARTPMGATDISAALRQSFLQQPATPMSVLYIGDGMSAADQLSLKKLDALVDDMISQSVSFHALLLGPNVDTQLPGVLANQTGGTFEYPASLNIAASAERLSKQLSSAPEFVSNLELNEQGLSLAANDAVALRADRHTIVFGKGAPANRVQVSGTDENGKQVVWNAAADSAAVVGEEVHVLFDRAEQSGGLNAAVVGLEGLQATSQEFKSVIDQYIAAAERFRISGQDEKALAIVRQAQLLDASNPTLTGLVSALQDESVDVPDDTEGAPAPAPPTPMSDSGEDRLGPPEAGEGDALENAAARAQIRTQQLVQATRAAIDEANRVAADQPEYALTLLKDLLETIRASVEVAPEKRNELERRVIDAYTDVNLARQTNQIRQREQSEQRATREAMDRLLQETEIEEKRLQTLISQVRGLLDRARHGDLPAYEEAETAARLALQKEPGNGTASAAVVMAETAGQLSKAYELVNLRHDRFLETLYQVELSHVPFPDEPPVLYPPADVWRALTLARKKKYESVSLSSEEPVEKWLEQMLDQPIPALSYPGENSLGEILQFLESYYTELGPYTMRIILDETDPDIGTDSEFLETTQVADVDLKGIKLRNALILIFAKVKDQDPGLTFMIKNEVMMVTTTDTTTSEENLITRLYDVADLVVPTVSQAGMGGMGGGMGGMGGGMGGMGGGMGGMGGGMGGMGGGMGGMGGGGQFSIPAEVMNAGDQGIQLKKSSIKKKPMK